LRINPNQERKTAMLEWGLILDGLPFSLRDPAFFAFE